MAINLFNRVEVDFRSLADHDKTLCCLLASEAAQWPAFAADMRRQGVAPSEVWDAREARHAYQIKSVGFGENDHV